MDVSTEDESVQGFINEKKNTGQHQAVETFSIYKLKAKVMNDKLERIRKQNA
jgi:hypothetical protein